MWDDAKGIFMPNVCIVRHKGYTKSTMLYPYQHNYRTLKISISELWKGKFSYRKFQDYMYDEALKIEKEKNTRLQKEKDTLNQSLKEMNELILAQTGEIQKNKKSSLKQRIRYCLRGIENQNSVL